jgi:diguanylate cyclase (GGDEF)-like protein
MVILGISIIAQIIRPVVKMSRDARLIAGGDIERNIEIKSDDEVGQLGCALNQLTLKIKEGMDELKGYSLKTANINLEIQKRIMAMSGMLQISEFISRGARLDEILHLCLEKLKGFADSAVGFFFFLEEGQFVLKAHSGLQIDSAKPLSFSSKSDCMQHIFKKQTFTVLDAKNVFAACQKLSASLGLRNLMCLPLFSRQGPLGLLGIGNDIENFTYTRNESELLDIFAKQVIIAIENDMLLRKVERLEIKDTLTGLYNEHYIRNRLDEEIERAITYQRPCGFILAQVQDFSAYQNTYGQIASEVALKKIASCVRDAFSGIERVGRFGDYEFAIILPEKNKRQVEKVAEDLRKNLEALFKSGSEPEKRLYLRTATAENPLDGASSQELISYAKGHLAD